MAKLDPFYKWTGGKRKEIKFFEKYFPSFIKNDEKYTYVEPFFGGGAVYWYLNNVKGNNVINDLETDIMNFLSCVKNQDEEFLREVLSIDNYLKDITKKEDNKELSIPDAKTERGKKYYELRGLDSNPGLKNISLTKRAIRFFIMNQLSFNGMRRFNGSGFFNVPYGNYKKIGNADLLSSPKHIELLKLTELNSTDFSEIMLRNDNENTFIYLDPPYTREFKEYTAGDAFLEKDQRRLSEIFKNSKKSKIMLIINDSELIRELYDGYIVEQYDIKYGTNIKNRYDTKSIHLIICNYK